MRRDAHMIAINFGKLLIYSILTNKIITSYTPVSHSEGLRKTA